MQKNVLEYLENAVQKYPDKLAFVDEKRGYTYLEFCLAAKRVATKICQTTTAVNQPIGVFVERSVESLIGFMAVLYSGNYYVPIDSKMPKQRIENVIEQVKPALLLYSREDAEVVQSVKKGLQEKSVEAFEISDKAETNEVSDGMEKKNGISDGVEMKNEIWEEELQKRRKKVLDIDPVYIIFTSGSTGTPKGIVISHRSVIDFTDWMAETFAFSEKDIMGNQAPFYFDLSVKDIYTTLKCGATTYILSKKFFMFPMLLPDYLNERKVTALIWATSAFHLVSNSGVLEKKKFETVQKVILGGEALLAKHLNRWKKAMPEIQYVNLYGPTEVTVDCTYYKIDRVFSEGEAVPIGIPCENKEILLLDENLQEVEDGMPGEICVRGTGVAKGYFGDWDKTSQVFIQNPRNPNYPDIIYRTGDIAIRNREGLLVFQSRKDGQIKHMGYRIELGEIERAVNGFEKIRAAICFYDDKNNKIVCVYEGDATEAEIIQYVQNCIPKYMYPNILRKEEKMPYNANGKIDRVKLKEAYQKEKGMEKNGVETN